MQTFSIKYYCIIYAIIMISFAFYWGNNFSEFTHYKGDESEVTFLFVTGLTYLLILLFHFTIRKLNILILLFIPIIIAVASFVLGLIFLLITGINGTPAAIIHTYVIIYLLITLLIVILFRKKWCA